MRIGHLFAIGMVTICALACDAVLGTDFSGYQAQPAQCDPLNPAGGAPTYLNCAADERCSLSGSTFQCISSTGGGKAPYDACTADTDCPVDYGCIQVGHLPDGKSTPVSVCLKWATDAGACSSPETLLTLPTSPVVGGKTYGNCFAPCDVLHSTKPSGPQFRTCGGGSRCSIVDDATNVASVAVCTPIPSSAEPRDFACASDEDCAVGLACRSFTAAGHCVDYCVAQSDCPAGRTCTPFTNKRYASTTSGEVDYSFCAPPPACEPVTNVPCGAGQSCTLSDDDYAVCLSAGSGSPGDWCQASSGAFCKQGEWCVGAAAYGYYCSDYCRIGKTDCPSGGTCMPLSPAETIGTQAYGFCQPPNCDPFNPQGASPPKRDCPNGVQCHFIDSSFMACRSGGTAQEGAACANSVDCGAGLYCIFYGTAGQCKVPCRVASGNADCIKVGKKTCTALATPFTIDGVEYGTCS